MYRWYVVNTYSGHENKVKSNLEHRAQTLGHRTAVRQIVVPTETITEVKDEIKGAGDQISNSGTGENGEVHLQLRGEEAGRATIEEVDRQVKGAFNETRGTSLERVTVLKNGMAPGCGLMSASSASNASDAGRMSGW